MQNAHFQHLRNFFPFFILINLLSACYQPGEESAIISLTEWRQVRPSTEEWLHSLGGNNPPIQWEDIKLPQSDNRAEDQSFLIQSTRLPLANLTQPGILFERINQSFRVELDGKILMEHGHLGRDESSSFQGFSWHLIHLPQDFSGKSLVIYSQSDYKSIGIRGTPKLGNVDELMRLKVLEGWHGLVSAAIMLAMSLTVMLAWFNGIKSFSLISIAIYSLVSGLFLIAINPISILIVHEPILLAYLEMLTLFALPVTGIRALASVTDPHSGTLLRRYVLVPTFFLLIALLGHLLGLRVLWNNYTIFNYINLLSMAVVSVILIRAALRGDGASLQVMFSLLIVVIGAASESLVSLRWIGTQFSVFNLTNLLCITVMLNIAIHHYFSIQKELQAERKKAENDRIKYAEEKERAVHTLVSGIAHEFNNPLAIILMGMHGIKGQIVESMLMQPRLLRLIEMTENGIARISSLNHSLLELSNLRDKHVTYSSTNLAELLETLKNDWPDVAIKGLDIMEEGPLNVITAPLYFKKVIDILLTNASEALAASNEKEQKTVEIELSTTEEKVIIDCLDWGKGLSEEALKNVFSPFYTTKDVGEGMGINLFFAREYTRSMGGDLTLLHASHPTCFRMVLLKAL